MSVLMINGTVWAGEDCLPQPGWVQLENSRIARTDRGEPSPQVLAAADHVVDLAGAHVIPGFVDVHTHLSSSALSPAAFDASPWTSVRQGLEQIRRDASTVGEGHWLLYLNADPHAWSEGRLPRVAELDEASHGRHVVVACVDIHRGAVSSEVLSALGITRTPSGHHSQDVVRGRRGSPTGELYEAALSTALAMAQRTLAEHLGDEGVSLLLDREAERHLNYGITHAHDPGVAPAAAEALVKLAQRTSLRLSWAAASPTGLLNPTPAAAQMPPGPYGVAPAEVKIFTDGADRCAIRLAPAAGLRMTTDALRAAARSRSLAPFLSDVSRSMRFTDGHLSTPSALRYTDAEFERTLTDHADAGHRMRIHALGNLAVDQVARTVKRLGLSSDSVTVEHVTLLSRADAALLAESGSWASYQPGFLPGYAKSLVPTGIYRHLAVLGGRSLLDAGARLILSSDQPCGPLDPLHNIRCAVHRRAGVYGVVQAEQALTVQEAIKASTTTAAASLGSPAAAGISAGAPADLAVLSHHPTDDRCHVLSTWIDGNSVSKPDRTRKS